MHNYKSNFFLYISQLFGEEDADNEVSPDSSDPELYKRETPSESGQDNCIPYFNNNY